MHSHERLLVQVCNPPLNTGLELGIHLHGSSVIANFLLKFSNFRCHGNQGRSGVSADDTIGFIAIENLLLGARIRNISPIEAQL